VSVLHHAYGLVEVGKLPEVICFDYSMMTRNIHLCSYGCKFSTRVVAMFLAKQDRTALAVDSPVLPLTFPQ